MPDKTVDDFLVSQKLKEWKMMTAPGRVPLAGTARVGGGGSGGFPVYVSEGLPLVSIPNTDLQK